MNNISLVIKKFIQEMNYLENEHVLGAFFYGSYLTGYAGKDSDIDLHIIFDDSDPKHLIRGNKHIDEMRIEYFEKPLRDLYLSVDNDYEKQNNALLSILGTSKILFDRNGALKQLQEYALKKFSQPLPPLPIEDARECVSIINNRMEKVKKALESDDPAFFHLYHLTIEKIRKFYHRLKGLPEVQTTKVFRVYTDENYRRSFYKEQIPEAEFISMYLEAITDMSIDKKTKFEKLSQLFEYSKRDVPLNDKDYRILIKSRNTFSGKTLPEIKTRYLDGDER